MTASTDTDLDPWRPGRVLGRQVPDLLRAWNDADGLQAADLHLAVTLGELAGEADPEVLLACALAVRAVREGSVCLHLGEVEHPGAEQVPPLPDPESWAARVAASPLVGPDAPWVWERHRLYLHRHLEDERQVAADLAAREESASVGPGGDGLEEALDEAYGLGAAGGEGAGEGEGAYADQRAAVRTACTHRTSIITGGPGSGKTTTLARLIAVLMRLHAARSPEAPPLRVHLAAPTGKAAARMAQSVRAAAEHPDFGFDDLRERLTALPATTVHRLLGSRPGHGSRFRHDRALRLPADVVVVDEASMLSLTLTARLLEALRPGARLVLLGDADQLASVDAGAVLTDMVEGLERRADPPVARLRGSRRFTGEIGDLAAAVRDGDVAATLRHLESARSGPEPHGVRWVPLDGAPSEAGGRELQQLMLTYARSLDEAGRTGDPEHALAALGGFRLLTAHREGPYGAGTWNRLTTRLLGASLQRHLPLSYVGRPLLVERNDPALGLFNGDTALVAAAPAGGEGSAGLVGVVDDGSRSGRVLGLPRLAGTTTAYAMTVHRAQGSQFDHVAVLLPDADSRVLTRQLLYTALTRASGRVTLIGTEASVEAAVGRSAGRATLLAARLSEPTDETGSGTGIRAADA
ncbi:exodeoxyribonuclease V subunit alpha [Nocardioidaceae bacterium]|nr:exodeoxyribonuclease V subunit alpha [Nocardioidaceae bacterium]